MNTSRFALLFLAVAGCTAAAYGLARRTRHLRKWQLEERLHTWEDEGGNLAPPADQPVLPGTAAPMRLASIL